MVSWYVAISITNRHQSSIAMHDVCLSHCFNAGAIIEYGLAGQTVVVRINTQSGSYVVTKDLLNKAPLQA